MPSIKQSAKFLQDAKDTGAIVDNTAAPMPDSFNYAAPGAPVPPTYPNETNPRLRTPMPASTTLQPDTVRQFFNAAIPQNRLLPQTSAANPVVGAASSSQAATIVKPSNPTVKGSLVWRGTWQSFVPYAKYDVVQFNISTYMALQSSTNLEPDANPTSWVLVSKNINPKGQYAPDGSISFVQKTPWTNAVSLIDTPVTFGKDTTATGCIVVYVFANGWTVAPTFSLTDTAGNTYTQVNGYVVNNTSDSYQTSVWIAQNINGGPVTITVSPLTGTGGGLALIALEYTELVEVDDIATQHFTATGNASVTVNTTEDNESILLFYFADDGSTPVITPPAGFIERSSQAVPPRYWEVYDKSITSPGSTVCTVSDSYTGVAVRILWGISLIGIGAAGYFPSDVVEYLGSTYICIVATGLSPLAAPSDWAQLSQGAGATTNIIANYTAQLEDYGRLLTNTSSSTWVLKLPSTPPLASWWIAIQQSGSGSIVVNPNGLDLDGSTSNITLNMNQGVLIFTDGTNYFTFRGLSSGVSISAVVNLTAQTANKSATTILGVTSAGLYRLTVYMVVSRAATSSSTLPDSRITFTDQDSGSAITIQATSGFSTNTLTTFAQASYIINAKASTNIQYDIGQVNAYASSGATSMQFSYRARLEYLG